MESLISIIIVIWVCCTLGNIEDSLKEISESLKNKQCEVVKGV
jgi:hypothetical protein